MASSKLNSEQQTWLNNRDSIMKYLDVDDMMDELIQARLVKQNTAQSLVLKSRVDKNRIVFEQLSKAGPGALERFTTILKNQRRPTSNSKELEKRKCCSRQIQ